MVRQSSKCAAPKRRRGAVAVEMALVLPIFCTMVFGIIEFGRGFMVSQLVTNAAREGTRRAIVDGSTNSDVTSAIQTYLNSACGVATADISITIAVAPATGNPANPTNSLASCASKDLITVTVSVPFNKVSLLTGNYLTGKNLTGKASMRHE